MRSLENLEAAARKEKEKIKVKTKRLYRLAREMGFNSVEARFLSQTSEKNIKRLAAEKLARRTL